MILGKKGNASLEEIEMTKEDGTIRTSQFIMRGKLNPGDKHFGMRSNLNYRKELLKKEKNNNG